MTSGNLRLQALPAGYTDPRDGLHRPAAYVLARTVRLRRPWNVDGFPDGGFWNASYGAVLPHTEILAADDQREAVLSFLRQGARLALQRATTSAAAP